MKKVKYKSLSQNSVQYQKKKKNFCGCKYFQFFFFPVKYYPTTEKKWISVWQ